MTITVITLTRCVNIRQTCSDYQVNLTVEPGQTVAGLKVERFAATQRWSFGFVFQAGKGRDAKVALTPDDGIPRPALSRERMSTIPVEDFAPAVPPTSVGASCIATRGAALPNGHRQLAMMFFPTKNGVPVRSIGVKYDTSGAAYEYTDRRGEVTVVQLSLDEGTSSRSTLVGGGPHTTISLDLLSQTGTATNSDNNGEETIVRLAGPNLLTAESLGRPADLIARIWKECKNMRQGGDPTS